MNELQIFNFEDLPVRKTEVNGEAYFLGKDVAEILGYSNTRDALAKHVDTEDKLTSQVATAGQKRNMVIINESGLYSLIFGAAKQSKKLITVNAIAKDYGMSAQALNKILHDLKVQFKQSGQWLLYAKYHDKGYTSSEPHKYTKKDGTEDFKLHTKWTQKGRISYTTY